MISKNNFIFELNISDAEKAFHRHINDFALVELKAPQYALPHHHTFFELIYVLNGSLTHSIHGERKQILNKGDFIFIDIGTSHEFYSDDADIINLVFTPAFINKKIQSCSSLRELLSTINIGIEQYSIFFPTDDILHDNDSTLLCMLSFLKTKFDNPQVLSNKIFNQCIISILMHILEPHIKNSYNINPIINSLVKIVDEHYIEQNLLTRASNELNYTIPYISAVFKNHFGMSFTEYLQIHRVNIAKSLLDSTDMSITDIGYAVGYANIKFFRSIFKKHTNMTPRQYRNTYYKELR